MPEPFELRLNGTYMVFRKLYQDVAAFRRYLVAAAKVALWHPMTIITRSWSRPK